MGYLGNGERDVERVFLKESLKRLERESEVIFEGFLFIFYFFLRVLIGGG